MNQLVLGKLRKRAIHLYTTVFQRNTLFQNQASYTFVLNKYYKIVNQLVE
ncbi:hypothetical protein KIH41_13580 [Litoribacter ruber]|nr:hypothetical protein [Litoribacter ruber]